MMQKPQLIESFIRSHVRRSRSLQLTERSPNRTRLHKTVVQISGNNAPKERPANRIATAPPNRRFVSNNVNNNRLAITNERQYKDVRNADLEKSRSLDSEYERYQNNARSDFDKSRSFDENYGDQVVQPKYMDSYANNMAPAKPNSPRGMRGYEHEVAYDKSRKTMQHSPLLSYKHDQKSMHAKMQQPMRGKREGERSPILNRDAMYRSITKSFDHLQTVAQQLPRDPSPTKRMHANHSAMLAKNVSPGSDYDLNASEFNVSYDIRNGKSDAKDPRHEYYFGGNANAESYLNQRRRDTTKATPSARYLRN